MDAQNGTTPMEIHTPRLLLREFSPEDVSAIEAYQSQAAYLEHNGRSAPTREQVVDFVDMLIRWSTETPRTRYQLVITREGRLIGTCGVRKAHPDSQEAEYGCELDPAAWGHGYAREASQAILDFGIHDLGLARIHAQTQPGNAAALRLAESLGFRCAADGACELALP